MACSESGIEEKFTFYWNIKNLRYTTLKNGEFLSSPKFYLANFHNTTWCIDLHPKGRNENYLEYISIYLSRENDIGPETIEIKCDIKGSYSDKVESFEHNFKKDSGYGFHEFIPREGKGLSESTFLIVCSLRCNGLATPNQLSKTENFLPSILKSDIDCISLAGDKLKVQAGTIGAKIKNQFFAWPKHCSALSQFFTQLKLLELTVDYSILKDTEFNQVIPATFSQTEYSLLVILTRESEFINMDIHLVNEDFHKSLLVVCQLTILINETESTMLCNKSHEFNTDEVNIWSLKQAFKICDLETKLNETIPGMAKWKFEFLFANGEVHSEILKESCYPEFNDAPIYPCLLSNKMEHFYNDQILCDVELIAKNKIFQAHKFVLSLMSPVFTAMFSSELEEKKTNYVNIEDIDENVLSDMISFMYTGVLKKLEFSNIQKLFSAADKYQIVSLKILCINFLIDNLTVENACSVLCLADLHNDSRLENAAVEVIALYKNIILFSDDWKKLEQENMSLVYKTVKKVCLQ